MTPQALPQLSELAVFVCQQRQKCRHVSGAQTQTGQRATAEGVEEVTGEQPSDASRWSDGGRRAEEKLEIRAAQSGCWEAFLKALISLPVLSAPVSPPYATLSCRGDRNI